MNENKFSASAGATQQTKTLSEKVQLCVKMITALEMARTGTMNRYKKEIQTKMNETIRSFFLLRRKL